MRTISNVMTYNHFSDNIVFMDGEFTSLNACTGELLSVGLVKYTGEESYVEIAYEGPVDPWVTKNVLPQLRGPVVSKEEAREHIKAFIGDSRPFCVAYVNQFDSIFWYKLFDSPKRHPVFWLPIDFAAILYGYGFDPESMNKKRFFDMIGVDKSAYAFHNALEDARLLAETYKKFFEHLKKA